MSNYQKILKSTATYGTNKPYVKSQTSSSASPLTTKGDVYTFSTSGARLAVGSNGQVLQADSTEDTGLKWVTSTSSNYYVDTVAFNTGNGVLTLGRVTLSDLTVDLDGRYLLSASALTSPLTTKGDVWVFGTANTRLAVGTDGYALVADSSTATGLNWAANSDANYVTTAATMGTNGILTGTVGGGGSNWVSNAFNVVTDGQVAYGQSTSGLTTGSSDLTWNGSKLLVEGDIELGSTSDKLIIPGKAEINGNGANVMINNLTSTHATITLKNTTADKNLSWLFNSTGSAKAEVKWKAEGTDAFILGTISSDPITFQISESEQMRLNSTGLGIGTTSPLKKLDVRGNNSTWALAALSGSSEYGTGLQLYNSHTTVQDWAILGGGASKNYTFRIYDQTAAKYRLAIDRNGKVGIGGSNDVIISPSAYLDVAASDLTALFGSDEGTNGALTNSTQKTARIGMPHYTNAEEPVGLIVGVSNATQNILQYGGGSSSFNAASVHKFYTSDGGFNTTNGTVRASIQGDANYSKLFLGADSTLGFYRYSNRMDFYISSNPRMHLDASKLYSATSGGPLLDLTPTTNEANYGFVDDPDTGMSRTAANTLVLMTAATAALTIDSSQVTTFANTPVVGTMTSSDNSTKAASTAFVKAQSYGTGTIGGSITDNQIAVGASTANSIEGSASFTYDAGTLDINDRLNIIATGAASVPVYFQPSQDGKEIQFRAYSSNLDIMRLTDAGKVGIGTTAPAKSLDVRGGTIRNQNDAGAVGAEFIGTSASIDMYRNSSSSYGSYFTFLKSQGTTASPTIIGAGQRIGDIDFKAYDGDSYENVAQIEGRLKDSTPSEGVVAGELLFGTRPTTEDGSVTTAMIIDSSQRVGIGTTSPNNTLSVVGVGAASQIGVSSDGTNWTNIYNDSSDNLIIDPPADFIVTGADDIKIQGGDDFEIICDDLSINNGSSNYAFFNGGDSALILGGGSTTVNGAPLHVSAGAGNLIANFDSTDGISEIRLRDNVGNGSEKYTRLLSVGNQLKLMPGDGYELMILDGSNKDVEVSGSFQLTNGAITSNPGTNHLWASGATLFWGGSQIGTTTPGAGAIQGTATAGQVSYGDGSNSITSTSNFTFTDNDGMTITTATSNKPTLMLKNTNTDGGAGELQFYKSTTSEGDGDAVGRINFYADNDAAQKTQYARIRGISKDMSDGTEDGRIEFAAMQGGTLTGLMEIGYDGNGNGMNLFAGGVSGSGLSQINYPDASNVYFMFGSDLSYSSGSATYKPAGIYTDGNPDPNDSGGDQQLIISAQDDVMIQAGNYGKNGGNDILLRTTNTAASNPTTRMRIKGDGKIGIGTDSPTAELDVRGSSSAGMAAFVSGTGNGTYPVMHVIDSADTEVAWFEGNRAGDTGAYIGVRHWPASATENARSGIKFQSKDDGGNLTNYASILMRINDYTNGTEDGTLRFNVMADGTETEELKIDKTGLYIDTYTRLQRNSSTNGLHLTDSGGNAVSFSTLSGSNGGLRLDNTTTNAIYRGSGVSFWDSTESYRLQGNTTSGYMQLDMNKIMLVRDASSAASNVLQIGDGGTYDQFSIVEDQRGSTATNGYLRLRAKKTGNFGYRKISLAAISGSTTSELMVDSISTNEALRFDTNSKSHALDIAKAGYVSIGAAVSTTDALYVNGNTTINGVLSATAKSFNIPHPLYKDKRLVHGSLEGPEHGIYIRGTIEASNGGLIELPEYWSAMCKDYTVQLTPHGPYTVFIEQKQMDKIMVGCTVKDFKFDYYIVGARTDQTLEVVKNA